MSSLVRFDEFIAAGHALEILKRGISAQRSPHAIILSGPPGVGKRTLSRAFAAALFCKAANSCSGCEQCRRIGERNHPDFLVVRRLDRTIREQGPLDDIEEDELTSDKGLSTLIRVFQIRDLTHHASFSPRQAPFRMFVIDPADRMNAEAQNALLKTLEEPPSGTKVLLLTSRPFRLLPTVRSRCLEVQLPALKPAELADILEQRGLDAEEAMERASLSGGRPGRAYTLDLEASRSAREQNLRLLETVAAGGLSAMAELPQWVSTIGVGSEHELQAGLDELSDLLREGLRIITGVESETLLDQSLQARVQVIAERMGPTALRSTIEKIEDLRGQLRFNINRTLAVETLLTQLAAQP